MRRPQRSRSKAPAASSPPHPGLAAREGATRLLGAVLTEGATLDERGLGHLAPPERAEAHRLAELTLRRLGEIDALLARFVSKPPPPPAQIILRLMAAELAFGETPPHAGVDLAVRLAKGRRDTGRFAGMVNAVGRRLAETDYTSAPDAGQKNMPDWLWRRLTKDWGGGAAEAIANAHLAGAPHDLTVRAAGDASPLAQELAARLLPTGSLRLTGRPQLSALPGYAAGAWWAQDAAAALPATLIPNPQGKRIVDLCAAPGGKTMQLAAAGADVIAVDVSAARMERLRDNLARTGLSAECIAADAFDWTPPAPADAVLIDAPCSATGTIRRHPDLPHRREADLDTLTDLQARLLDRAVGWLRPGGTLVFATCSLFRAEGEKQAEAFLARTPTVERMALVDEVPDEFRTAQGDMRTRPDHWPDLGGIDGFFAARFRRLDEQA